MKFLTKKTKKNLVLTLLFAGLLIISSVAFTNQALAQTSVVDPLKTEISTPQVVNTDNPEGAITRFLEIVKEPLNNTEISLQQLFQQTELIYHQTVQDTNNVIEQLRQQLASSTNLPDIGNSQDLLENLADSIDNLGEKVANFNKESEDFASFLNSQLSNNIENLQLSLENIAKKIAILADDIEHAKQGASTFLRTEIDKEIATVKQALQEGDQFFKELNRNAS